MIKKIVSGGQIGVEQAALDIAIKLGVYHSGWIQKGRRTESWTLPEKYQLKEMTTASYKERIERNVIDSDGTLIISHGRLAGGADYSRKMAEKHNRPCLHINLKETPGFFAASAINTWVGEKDIEVLNVTGPKASEDPEIYKAAMDILESVYYLGEMDQKTVAFDSLHAADLPRRQPELSGYPKTVDEAVDRLISELQLKDRTTLSNMSAEEVAALNRTLGKYVRDNFGLWRDNPALIESCRRISKTDVSNEDVASMVILIALWEKLRETHRLRVIK
ncbi:MAG: putative molybdenum carrier protein [Pseudomonadota bacterium]